MAATATRWPRQQLPANNSTGQGRSRFRPLASRGRFTVKALHVTTLTGLAGTAVPLTVASGLISLDGGYDFKLHDGAAGLTVDLQSLALTDLALRAHNGEVDYVVLPRIDVDGTHLDLTQRSVVVDALRIAGGQIHGWLNDNGSLNLAELGGAAAAAPAAAPAAPAPAMRRPPRAAGGARLDGKGPKD